MVLGHVYNLPQPPYVDPCIFRQLWMEARSKDIALFYSNDISSFVLQSHCSDSFSELSTSTRQIRHDLNRPKDSLRHLTFRTLGWRNDHLLNRSFTRVLSSYYRQYFLDNWRSDEDSIERFDVSCSVLCAEERQGQLSFEALRLSPEIIAIDSHVQATDELLTPFFRAIGGLG